MDLSGAILGALGEAPCEGRKQHRQQQGHWGAWALFLIALVDPAARFEHARDTPGRAACVGEGAQVGNGERFEVFSVPLGEGQPLSPCPLGDPVEGEVQELFTHNHVRHRHIQVGDQIDQIGLGDVLEDRKLCWGKTGHKDLRDMVAAGGSALTA